MTKSTTGSPRWTPVSSRRPPTGVLVEIRDPRTETITRAQHEAGSIVSVWRCGNGSTLYANLDMLWRYPNGARPTAAQVREQQAALKELESQEDEQQALREQRRRQRLPKVA